MTATGAYRFVVYACFAGLGTALGIVALDYGLILS